MESASSASVNVGSNQKIDETNSSDWEKALSSNNSDNNGWKIEISVKNNSDNSKTIASNNNAVEGVGNTSSNNNQMPPEVRKVLENLIGNMGIEMVKTQNPAQKISMSEDKE